MERIEAERIKDEQNASVDVVETNRMDDIKEPVTISKRFPVPLPRVDATGFDLRPLRPEFTLDGFI